ncbi:KAP family P-loop NTPase fold protein [Herbidospora daliensis]|uniref:KAP family P-loop NTPase fold protein n=1 Tax=Herbidospora daliensis TaxID=295585 RepID=UPI000A043A9B|nr:P-loop NTPase fold protein [Herbidospora daliensis]
MPLPPGDVLAPAVTSRRALVFLDQDPPGRRLASALRSSGYAVETCPSGRRDHERLAAFLASGRPGDLLLVRWPSTSTWSGADFATLVKRFGASVGETTASAVLMIVDFGWIGSASPDEQTVSALLTPPGIAAAALTTGLALGAEVRPGAPSLTEVVADGLLTFDADLGGDGVVSVADLLAHALAAFGEHAEFLPHLLTSPEALDVAVAVRGTVPGTLPTVFERAAAMLGGPRPKSAEQAVARIYDEHLSVDAQLLLRRGSLLSEGERLTGEVAEVLGGTRKGRTELAEWGLLGEPFSHPAVALFGRARLDDDERATLPGALRRWRARRRATRPRARLTPDRWTVDDHLGHRVYAEAIAAFIRHAETRPPLTIGVKGPWGTGKTSLMRMIQEELDPGAPAGNARELRLPRSLPARPPARLIRLLARLWPGNRASEGVTNAEVRALSKEAEGEPAPVEATTGGWRPTVWFNPWMYQNDEQVWAGLAHEIITQITDRLPRAERERFWLRLNLARVDREAVRRRAYHLALMRLGPAVLGLVLTLLLSGASLLAAPLLPFLDGAAGALASGGAVAAVFAASVRLARFLTESAESAFASLVRAPDPLSGDGPGYGARTGFLHLVQTDMKHVLDLVATSERPLVVFVDDLDRCSSGAVAQVIEAINLFLAGEFPNCVFVLAMEPEVVAAHVEVAYRDLAESMPAHLREDLGWRFLEKIVQLPLRVPLLDEDARLPEYVRALMDIPAQRRAPVAAPVRPSVDLAMVARIERQIRGSGARVDTLDEAARVAQDTVAVDEGETSALGGLWAETRLAADRVFDDLYSDENAYRAIRGALPVLAASNPRELKRYVNVFRFYSFVTYRQRLAGERAASDAEVAKLAALTVRWPHLLSRLSGGTVLGKLEEAARDGGRWDEALHDAGLEPGPRWDPLKVLLAAPPSVTDLARRLL